MTEKPKLTDQLIINCPNAITALRLLGQQLLLTTSGGEDRQEMYKQFLDMFDAQGVVDIAFKTDTAHSKVN